MSIPFRSSFALAISLAASVAAAQVRPQETQPKEPKPTAGASATKPAPKAADPKPSATKSVEAKPAAEMLFSYGFIDEQFFVT